MGSTDGLYNAAVKHPVFWFNDGSIVLHVENQAFKVHRTLLSRHSRFFAETDPSASMNDRYDLSLDSYISVDQSRNVRARDVEVLLEHLYHDASLLSEDEIPRLAAALRVSSPKQLDFPSIHALTMKRLISVIPTKYSPGFLPDDPEEALELATEYELPLMRKALYYHFVTSPSSYFDAISYHTQSLGDSPPLSEADSDTVKHEAANQPRRPLSQTDAKLCAQLMERIIEHFTPILFTPATTPHMACTNVFADTWMSLVIQPAIEDNGVYKPLETLERIKSIDWADAGLCAACVKEKNEEWTQEQQHIWNTMDTWLGLETGQMIPVSM
ncbi:hypothetical protein H2248_007889 [Termitomyces sp. 'cryptogamus']|nr:hypothetical protein H2248_007889 [Termitomyces sp. 'cryptogamus']